MRNRIAILAFAKAAALGTEPGRITGRLACGEPQEMRVVWAVAADCRIAYKTAEFDRSRYTFDSIPPGACRLLPYCAHMYAQLSRQFHVSPGETVTADPVVDYAPDGLQGSAPLNGRIVDESGHPIVGAKVHGDVHPLGSIQPEGEAASGPDGRFGFCAVRLLIGKLTLTVTHPDYRTRKVRLPLDPFNYPDSYFNGSIEIKLRQKRNK